jgi:hypothetical protein
MGVLISWMGVSKQLFIYGSNSTPMTTEDRSNYKKIQVWVPLPLWNELGSLGYSSPTIAVITALELLCTKSQDTPVDTPLDSQDTPLIDILNTKLEEKHKELQAHQQNRIADLKEQIQALNDQINKKDKLVEGLNQTLMAQASNIYNLTQSPKLLPENKTKKWWEFWKN